MMNKFPCATIVDYHGNKHFSVLMEKGGMMMPDREKVIKEFELFIKELHPACTSEGVELDMFREVLALLKEQGAVKPMKRIEQNEWTVCGVCENHIISKWKFCPYCGRAVKWDA